MASKNAIALFLTINIVLFGFTAAQAPGSQAPTCPRDSIQIQACVNALRLNLTLNTQTVRPCCTLVAGLSPSVASVCICNALKITILNLVEVRVRLDQVLRLCNVPPPAGFNCCN